MTAVKAVDLYRFFHTGESETLALRGVSMEVEGGEMVALVGASGSGKSTLLSCLAGLDEPDGGHVDLFGERLSRRPETERAARRASAVGILMQSRNLFATLTLSENIGFIMRLAHRVDTARQERLLARVGLAHRRTARPSQLSGGELARAGLAAALAAGPRVLFADEPTAEVDAATEMQVLDLLRDECHRGTAILIATHSSALAGRADRMLHLRDGSLVHG